MRSGYVIFPQANVESEPSPLPDAERMQRELHLVDLAGELGFEEFWVTEHHFGDYNLAPSPLQLLSYIAGRFPAASVGTMVIVLPWNDPLRVVEQVVVLDYLSQGRLLVGFGKGDARREFNAFGVDLAEARQRFDENLAVVLRALETGALERDGDPRVEVRPQPRGSFSGRLYMAAGSPASLDRAAESGLGLLRIGLRSWDEVAEQVRRHRVAFVAAHDHEPPPTVTLTYGFVDRDAGRARELGRQYAQAYRLSAIDHYELGPDADAEMEAFAEAQLWGTPDQVVEKAAYLAEATRTGHLAYAFRYAGVPYEDAVSSMRLFAAEVAPRLREIPRAMNAPAVEELIRSVSNWGRFGEDDERGTANLITPEKRLQAARCVRSGEAFSLAVDFEPDTPQFKASYRLNPQRSMVATGTDVKTGRQSAYGIEGHGFADDMVVMSLQAATQWDSLAHVFHDYRMYNGRDCALVGAKGAEANDIAVLRDRVVTRGVLADVPAQLGVEALSPDHHITVAELEETLAAQGLEVESGDALLVRTGHLGRIRREDAWDRFVESDEPGLGWDALPWLREHDVAAVAADNWAFEVVPSRYDLPLPFHAIGIVYMGLLIGEIFELDELARACRARGAWDFLFSAPPLPFIGAVGSPVNPIAVL